MTLLTAMFLRSEIAIIEIKARTKRTAPEYQENECPGGFHAEAATADPTEVVAHLDEVRSASENTGLFATRLLSC